MPVKLMKPELEEAVKGKPSPSLREPPKCSCGALLVIQVEPGTQQTVRACLSCDATTGRE